MSAYHGAPLTEEEEYLLERFRILREKKKILQKLKEKAETKAKPAVKRELVKTTNSTPEDAKKKAEMLVASGCVKISKASVDREFKRARTMDKKSSREGLSDQEAVDKKASSRTAMKDMYAGSFVKGGQKNEMHKDWTYGNHTYREPRRGNTIFIKGYGLKEEIVRNDFNKFGTVTNVRYEKDRRHGFVTFKTCEEAEKAIEEMNGTMVSGVHIEVSLARKQLHMDHQRTANPIWSSREVRPWERHDKASGRELQTYKDDFF